MIIYDLLTPLFVISFFLHLTSEFSILVYPIYTFIPLRIICSFEIRFLSVAPGFGIFIPSISAKPLFSINDLHI
ncbi:uncharacterized protein RJT21DRAFT_118051 [Scheffersomyces amazonensis]|uniref:uncharacterized protein n=1 Tax=Scheffersomyces amazonensis TaxID=1078765 RepID=UPI00315C4C7F